MDDVKKIRFFNFYGNGDLFATREFVRELIQNRPIVSYEYSHGKSPRMFADIDGLGYSKIDDTCDNSKFLYKVEDTVYINTWVGLNGRYVTSANTVCLSNVRRLFNDAFGGLYKFEKDLNEYIARIDFSKFNIKPVNEFILNKRSAPLVFISNCNAQSSQAVNFDFDPVIERLCDEFVDSDFIATNETRIIKPNLFYSKDITQSEDGFDLNELSYLSIYCNPIIGRGSGSYCFAINKENCFSTEPSKYFVGFTTTPFGCDLTIGQLLPKVVLFSPETEQTKVGNIISSVLRGLS